MAPRERAKIKKKRIQATNQTNAKPPAPSVQSITKTRLFKYIENFTTIKIENFHIKNPDIFHISAQNIDCGYSLEPPRREIYVLSRNKKNIVYPCKPQFFYIKVGFKGVKII